MAVLNSGLRLFVASALLEGLKVPDIEGACLTRLRMFPDLVGSGRG